MVNYGNFIKAPVENTVGLQLVNLREICVRKIIRKLRAYVAAVHKINNIVKYFTVEDGNDHSAILF